MLQRLKDKLDLTKKYPNYVGQHTKWMVRCLFALIFIYLLYLGSTYGWGTNLTISCPEYSERCFNEYYYEGCTEDYCSTQYLLGGETRGKPFPVEAFQNFWMLLCAGLFLIVVVNHWIWLTRGMK